MASVKVRQALNYAVNRPVLTKALEGQYAQPTDQWSTTDAINASYASYYSYNPTEAKRLLAAAGYPHGFTLSVADESISGTTGDQMVQALAQELQAVGVTLKITTASTSAQANTNYLSGNFPAIQLPQTANPMAIEFTVTQQKGGVWYQHGNTLPQYAALYGRGLVANNPTPIWQKLSGLFVTDADMLPVFNFDQLYYVSPHVGGVGISLGSQGFSFPTYWYPTH